MIFSPRTTNNSDSFTLVELLTVMAIIAILAALVLSISGYAQKKGAMARADAEIHALEAACEGYKSDNGIYPRGPGSQTTIGSTNVSGSATDLLDARVSGNPSNYAQASVYLYSQLSGDTNGNGIIESSEVSNKRYFEFKPTMLSGTVSYIADPWGNSYGYSTAYQGWVDKGSTGAQKGYNPTFDLWSTTGKTTTPAPGNATDVTQQWIKNW